MQQTLYFVHDPMCSWCWAFRPVWQQVQAALPDSITTVRLLGGLAPDTDEPMPESMQNYLQDAWRTIQQRVPGTRFNFDFWSDCRPRRATYPANRAVIAAKLQDAGFEEPMIEAIQQAYYLHARNPSDTDTLIALAGEIGLDVSQFSEALSSSATQDYLQQEIHQGRQMGVSSFPSLVLESEGSFKPLQHDYLDVGSILEQIG